MSKNETTGNASSIDYRDEDTLRRLYHEKGLNTKQIADRADCTAQTIINWMDKYGIERRPPGGWYNMQQRVPFRTTKSGYECWEYSDLGEKGVVLVHRLAAVAENGFGAVVENQIHHKNQIPWDNRSENLQPISHEEHSRLHAKEVHERDRAHDQRDNQGRFC